MVAGLADAERLRGQLAAAITDAGAGVPLELYAAHHTKALSWRLSAILKPLAAGPHFGNAHLHWGAVDASEPWADPRIAAAIEVITKGTSHVE